MDTSRRSVPSLRGARAAFSLIEVTLAIGIVAFAFVAVFGLLPTGMNVFRQSMNNSVTSQIAQRVINDCQQSDFSALITDYKNQTLDPITTANITGQKVYRFFDDQGNEVLPAGLNSSGANASPLPSLTAAEKQKIIYWVNTRITPATPLPSSGSNSDLTTLATVTVQVANNPGNQDLAVSTATNDQSDANFAQRNLWTSAYNATPSKTGVVTIVTYSALVSKNQ